MNDWHDAERRFDRALELLRQRKLPQALEEMRLATSINPFNARWFVNLGQILDELRRHEEALEAYRKASRIDPNHLPIQERLGVAMIRTGRLRQALRTFARTNLADPAFEPGYCHRILIHSELGEHDKAEEMFYTARLYKDHCPRCYDHMGRSLAARQSYDRAIFCFRKCLDMEPAWPGGAGRLADAFWHKGDLEQARLHFLAELRQNPGSTKILLSLGDLLVEMGRIEEAGEKFRRCIELAPSEAAGYSRYGRWLSRCHKDADAQMNFHHALRLDPTLAGVHLELGRLAVRRGDRAEAQRHLRSEHLLRSDDVTTLMGLANLWMDCGEDRTAIASLKRLIQFQPRHAQAWLNLAVAQFHCGLYPEGIRSCHTVLDLENAAPSEGKTLLLAMYNLALAHDRQRQYATALEWSRRALLLEPRDAALQRLEMRLRVLSWASSLFSGLRRMFDPNH